MGLHSPPWVQRHSCFYRRVPLCPRVLQSTLLGSGFTLRPSEVPAPWPILGCMGPRRHARLEADVS